MKVIIVGCGQVGSTLAYQLYSMGHRVLVIDQNETAFDNLPVDFQGRTVEGDVLARNVLHRAELEQADALFAVTGSDPLNALVAHLARSDYAVPIVAARNCDPRHKALQEAFGVTVIGSPGWSAESVVEMLSSDALRAIYLDPAADLVIYKLEVPEKWSRRSLDELIPVGQGQILKWTRNGQDTLALETRLLQAGDLVYLSADPAVIEALRDRLGFKQEQRL